MIQFAIDYWIYIAIYWLLMFTIMLVNKPKPEHWTVWMIVWFVSFFFPVMLVYFIGLKVIEKVRDN